MTRKKLAIAVVVLCSAMTVCAVFGGSVVPWGHSLCESAYDTPKTKIYEPSEIEMPEPSESPKSNTSEILKGNQKQDLKPLNESWTHGDANESWSSDYDSFDYDSIPETQLPESWSSDYEPFPDVYPDINPPDIYPDFDPGVPGSPFSGGWGDDELDPWHPWPPDMP